MKRLILYYTFIIANLIIFTGFASAQEYKIGPEDVLSVTFWQEPQLNTNVRVNQNGTIVLPVIGTITAAGLTPNELAAKIVRRISVFNRNISQASVLVTQYESNKVYVTGSVQNPGKYSFEVIPDLWKIILEAGGPTETAKLDQVKIIRGGDEAGDISNVDLSEFLKRGDLSKLPPVYPGDTLYAEIEVADKRESKTKPDRGIITFKNTVKNQNDETVALVTISFMYRRRPK